MWWRVTIADRSWYTLPGENKINQHSNIAPQYGLGPKWKVVFQLTFYKGYCMIVLGTVFTWEKNMTHLNQFAFPRKDTWKKYIGHWISSRIPAFFFCGQLGPALMVRSNGQSSKQPCEFNTRGFCWLESLLFFLPFFDRWVKKLRWKRFIFSRNLLLHKGSLVQV